MLLLLLCGVDKEVSTATQPLLHMLILHSCTGFWQCVLISLCLCGLGVSLSYVPCAPRSSSRTT